MTGEIAADIRVETCETTTYTHTHSRSVDSDFVSDERSAINNTATD